MYYKIFQGKKSTFLLEKGFFSDFSFHFHVFNENEGKSKKHINFFFAFHFFLSKLHKLFPFQRFLSELTSYLRKTIFILVQKKGMYSISRKKFLFTVKVNFLMIFCLFHCFHQTINKKHEILPQYTFF